LEVTIVAKTKNTDFEEVIEAPVETPTEVPTETPPVFEAPCTQERNTLVRLAYVGPNVPGGILQRFQVFKGGLPPYCKDLFERVPEIKELFVPVEALEATRKKIEEPGTNEARIFYAVQKKLAKGVK
jgi:hypothetical protein